MMPPLRTADAPPAALVFAHFAAAGGFLLAGCAAALVGAGDFAGFYAQPRLLAVTHLLVLGWINLCAFGVLLQLVPVIFRAPLRWPRLAWAHLVLYAGGTAGLAAAFWAGRLDAPLVAAGAITGLGVVLLLVNLGATLAASPQRDASAWIIGGALLNLLLTATLGVLLAVNFTHPFLPRLHLDYLKLHAHLGFAGWLLGLIIGAGRRLLPMFLVAPERPPGRALAAFGLVQGGLLLWAGGVFARTAGAAWIVPAAAAAIAAGLALWLVEAAAIFRSRVRRELDAPLKTVGAALAALGVAAGAGLIVAAPGWSPGPSVQAYGVLVVVGAVSLLVQAFLYKIVPFLVWLHRWSPRLARGPVPTLRGLTDRAWIRTQLALFAGGSAVVAAGMVAQQVALLRGGAATLVISAALLAVNFLRLGLRAPALPEPGHFSPDTTRTAAQP